MSALNYSGFDEAPLFGRNQKGDRIDSEGTVRALWGNSASLRSVASADGTGQATNGGAPQPLDLFSDRNGTFSS